MKKEQKMLWAVKLDSSHRQPSFFSIGHQTSPETKQGVNDVAESLFSSSKPEDEMHVKAPQKQRSNVCFHQDQVTRLPSYASYLWHEKLFVAPHIQNMRKDEDLSRCKYYFYSTLLHSVFIKYSHLLNFFIYSCFSRKPQCVKHPQISVYLGSGRRRKLSPNPLKYFTNKNLKQVASFKCNPMYCMHGKQSN